ncbi:MAG: NAD(P)/FAD-dependent oxidoreductase [Lachnospiraceae bacterium]|nr:NAD(P)/FAD-dependent oxidoreductase [Lachnospiraceae bacterium]
MYDAAIIGTGPAGVSAALNLKIHNKNFIWLGSRNLSDKVTKAEKIVNYPGFPETTGEGLNNAFKAHIESAGIEITEGMVTAIYPMEDHYALAVSSEFFEARVLLLATGIAMRNTLPGESEKVGRGVSYCATCDGGLYRGKEIAVVCNNPRFEHEVKYLAELASAVHYFPLYKGIIDMPENVFIESGRPKAVDGEERVSVVITSSGDQIPVDGVFFLRDSIALNNLLPGLETTEGHIAVDRSMATNLPGVFAAGDCTGTPYQYTKAVGEGNVAAHSMISYLAEK